jgi:hypothetical protein
MKDENRARLHRKILGAAAAAAACFSLAFPVAASSAGPEIFLQEEPETYLVIDKLEGMGFLPGLMTGDRGLEAGEVAAEAEKALGAGDPFEDGMLRFLMLGAAKRHDFRLRAGLEHSGDGRVPPNAQGFPVPEDGGIRAGGFFRAAPADWLSLQGRGDVLAGFDGDTTGRLMETSVRLGWPQATLEAGRFSLWWGPGRHGSLLFTTNAEPLTGVRIRNPRPIRPGWWLRPLGLLQYDLFVARLEGSRPIPHSTLSGIRLAIKPASWLELGTSRAMHFGGEGRRGGISVWWEEFKGTEVNEPGKETNQLGGFDASVLIPWKVQPVKVYVETAGEDQVEGHVVALPYKWAVASGIFLPSIGRNARWDFRIEYATNRIRGHGPVWYVHGGYPHRYRGEILGHHMGTDARDLFIEAHYFLLPSSYLEANVDVTRRHFPGPAREETVRASGAVVAWLTKTLRVEGRLAVEDVSNEDGVPRPGRTRRGPPDGNLLPVPVTRCRG